MIFDLHNDYLTGKKDSESSDIGDVKGAVFALWTSRIDSINELKRLYADYTALSIGNKLFAFEDVGFLSSASFDALGYFSPAYCSLTWNYDNAFAGGALQNGNLSAKGRDLIRYMNDSGIVFDVAHLNRKSFYSALDASKGKVICSHCCFAGVREHPRNLTDEQISLLVGRDGLVGFTFVNDFISDNRVATLDDAVRHIDYFAEKFGMKYLAIGSDFFGTDSSCGIKCYKDFALLDNALKRRGYSGEDIDALFYKNAFKFFFS